MPCIAILTSGGDAPGMNAVLYAIASAAKFLEIDVVFVINGYQGLLDKKFKKISFSELKDSIFLPGSLIGSSRCLEFKDSPQARERAVSNLRDIGADALFVVGGNGSYQGAKLVAQLNFPVIALPGTIDNDVASTKYTIGFFSALEEIFHAIRKIKATSDSHSQITFLELMGRDCCDLTLFAAAATSADFLVTNKNPKTSDELAVVLKEMKEKGKKGIVILVTEKIYGPSFGFNLPTLPEVAAALEKKLGCQVRVSVLGYVQRGAYPTSFEMSVAAGFGKFAFEQYKNKNLNVAIGFDGFNYYCTNIIDANEMTKEIDVDLIEYQNLLYKII